MARRWRETSTYQALADGQRWELVNGDLFAMSPAPTVRHQAVLGRLYRRLDTHFDGKRCQVFPAPIDVKLSEHDVVQPDLVVVCDPMQLKPTHVEGPPSLVVEILSRSTETFDRGSEGEAIRAQRGQGGLVGHSVHFSSV